MNEMDDIVREFVVESQEGLDQLDQDLVALEQDPKNGDLLAAIFRCIHSIKGTCGFLGFSNLESVTHVGENLLSKLRDGAVSLSPEMTDALLAMVDVVRGMITTIESTGTDGDTDHTELIATLEGLLDGDEPARGSSAGSDTVDVADEDSPRDPAETPAAAGDGPVRTVAETSIRVDVDLLDRLMNLVGELVLARNQIVQSAADTPFAASAQHLNLITTELQEGVMKTRMQPISNISRARDSVEEETNASMK